MTLNENVSRLLKHLRTMQFHGISKHIIKAMLRTGQEAFSLHYWRKFGSDEMKYKIRFEKDTTYGGYRIESYEAVLRKEPQISETFIAGIDIGKLAARMTRLDWSADYHQEAVLGRDDSAASKAQQMGGIIADLQKLNQFSDAGRKATAALAYKFWVDTPLQLNSSDVQALQTKYEYKTTIHPIIPITASEAYTLLNHRAFIQQNQTVMNNENLKFLADRLKFGGWGKEIKEQLEKKMREGAPEFHLSFATEMNKKPFEAILNFRKSDTSDMYFFNNYHASLERNDGQKVEQTFYLNNGKGITAKEAFNLLDGRAVHKDMATKEGQPYKAWLQLNPEVIDKNGNAKVEQYHEKYGYDLQAAVGKFAVSELKEPEKAEKLMQSLQKGNIQSVTIEKEGSVQSLFMEADPRFKSLKLYDAEMKMVPKEDLSRYQNVVKSSALKADGKDMDKKKEKGQSNKQNKNLKNVDGKSLLPKKRQSTNKGLGVA